LGHLNQKNLLPGINGYACVLQAPHSVSLAVFCNRHVLSPLTSKRSEFCLKTPRPGGQDAIGLE
jgi:hypothetical protein